MYEFLSQHTDTLVWVASQIFAMLPAQKLLAGNTPFIVWCHVAFFVTNEWGVH